MCKATVIAVIVNVVIAIVGKKSPGLKTRYEEGLTNIINLLDLATN